MEQIILKNKVAIITGASKGIGKAIALNFATNFAKLVLICHKDMDSLKSIQSQINQLGSETLCMKGDLAEESFCAEVIDKTISKFGKIDIVVNCAGTISRENTNDVSSSKWNYVINVNLYSAFYLTKFALPFMKSKKFGRIINITSQMAHTPHPSASSSYEVSKSGLHALTRHLALEYANDNILVNSIAPGSIDTDLPKSMTKSQRSAIENRIPLGRLGTVEEVSDCALFLASDLSTYITGSTIHINGGSLIL